MKIRIISGLTALALLLCVLFLLPDWVLAVVGAVLSALGVREFLGATGFVKNRAMLICAIAFSLTVAPWRSDSKPGNAMASLPRKNPLCPSTDGAAQMAHSSLPFAWQ